MISKTHEGGKNRRAFLKEAAFGGLALASHAANLAAPASGAEAANWKNQAGLQLFTLLNLMPNVESYEGVLAKVAQIGYKEVELGSFGTLPEPKAFRAMLDRNSLSMPSAHAPLIEGPNLEKQLEGFQIIGTRYAPMMPANFPPPSPALLAALASGTFRDPATGLVHHIFKDTAAFAPPEPPSTLESAKQTAAKLNALGKITQKFGVKVLVHNHTTEFEKLVDSPQTTYDVLLAETDPEFVTMELDIGWASIAGVNVVELFKKHPGRFELWHVKDAVGLRTVNPALSPNARVSSMAFVPVGAGQVDYKEIFADAQLAGLKHFFVEQDNAASWGDSLAAVRTSFNNLMELLS